MDGQPDGRPVFNTDNVSDVFAGAQEYQKQVPTKAVKIDGAFDVETSEGRLSCEGGYLALDARGYPYPIATDEFELIYKPVSAQDAGDLLGMLRDQHGAHVALLLIRSDAPAEPSNLDEAISHVQGAIGQHGFHIADTRYAGDAAPQESPAPDAPAEPSPTPEADGPPAEQTETPEAPPSS